MEEGESLTPLLSPVLLLSNRLTEMRRLGRSATNKLNAIQNLTGQKVSETLGSTNSEENNEKNVDPQDDPDLKDKEAPR